MMKELGATKVLVLDSSKSADEYSKAIIDATNGSHCLRSDGIFYRIECINECMK